MFTFASNTNSRPFNKVPAFLSQTFFCRCTSPISPEGLKTFVFAHGNSFPNISVRGSGYKIYCLRPIWPPEQGPLKFTDVPTYFFLFRLLWTKAAYDYMYSSGETLLRNFPVQATIQVVDYPSDSSDEEEEDRCECDEQERGTKMSSEQEGVTNCAQCEQKELKS